MRGRWFLFLLFQTHYFQRAFIFPLLMRGSSKMPLGIVVMGMVFNTLNALMQGGWIFFVSPDGFYDDWFAKPYIYVGGAIFFAGMAINLHADYIIRHLRKPGDTRHYIPRGVCSVTFRRPIISENLSNGRALPYLHGRLPERYSLCGLSPIWHLVLASCATVMPESSVRNSPRSAASASYLSYIRINT